MTQLTEKWRVIENLGFMDRIIRMMAGVFLLAPIILTVVQDKAVGWELYTTLLSFYLLLTSMMGWDPFYAMSHTRSCGLSERSPCGTFEYEAKAAMGRHPDHDKGYETHALKPEERVKAAPYDGGSVL